MADDHHSTTAPPPDLPPISPNSPPPEHQETPPPPENQETSPPPHPATDQETTPPPPPTTTIGDVIDQPEKPTKTPEPMPSFKEESNQIKDLSPSQQNSLQDFKTLIQQAITNQDFTFLQNQNQPISQLSIWGIPIFQDDRTDVVLLKFLRARDFKVQDSFTMFKDTLQWRKTFDIESLLEENLGDDLEKVVFNHGFDKEGHPVCYNVYGEFQNKELYNKMFSDNEGRLRFLRWRIQYLERSIRKLDFRPGGVNTIFQISDLKNSPGPAKRELRLATRQALQILQDNYPEFVAKQDR
ncbi:putative CRAL-TRIO lipid binding domain, CRAL/TRIO domain, CRAL/TRIO domain superfamily, patellin [Helianthus annuus]|nr:putative CRAL-TRIO lipid binding domain, CRAL/TRIO domain, CRAL/TRIO domain superfamily, patellin [Helianthus annuus]